MRDRGTSKKRQEIILCSLDHLSITLGAPWLRGLKAVGVTTKKRF
jgi:hypothetical protein